MIESPAVLCVYLCSAVHRDCVTSDAIQNWSRPGTGGSVMGVGAVRLKVFAYTPAFMYSRSTPNACKTKRQVYTLMLPSSFIII